MIKLKKMNKDEFKIFYKKSIKRYAKSLVKIKYTHKNNSLKKSRQRYESMLPKGFKTTKHIFYNIKNSENKKIGLIWLIRTKNLFFIAEIFIKKKFRHQGYGTDVLNHLKEKAKKENYDKVSLNVFKYNKKAKSLYKKVGFEPSDESMFLKI